MRLTASLPPCAEFCDGGSVNGALEAYAARGEFVRCRAGGGGRRRACVATCARRTVFVCVCHALRGLWGLRRVQCDVGFADMRCRSLSGWCCRGSATPRTACGTCTRKCVWSLVLLVLLLRARASVLISRTQAPPIAHRDIKLENLLLRNGRTKARFRSRLCHTRSF